MNHLKRVVFLFINDENNTAHVEASDYEYFFICLQVFIHTFDLSFFYYRSSNSNNYTIS